MVAEKWLSSLLGSATCAASPRPPTNCFLRRQLTGVIVHVPHASTRIPEDVRRGIVLDDVALARELFASTDHHTDAFVAGLEEELGGGRLGPGDSGARVRVHVNGLSRLVVDPGASSTPSVR